MRTELGSKNFSTNWLRQEAVVLHAPSKSLKTRPVLPHRITVRPSIPGLTVALSSPKDLRGGATTEAAAQDSAILATLLEKFDVPKDGVAMLQAAVEALASRRMLDAERRCSGAESKHASAESQRASAEQRWGEANVELKELSLRLNKADQVARQRYVDLLMLKGSVHLREEINIIEREYVSLLKSKKASMRAASGPGGKRANHQHFSRIDIWTFFFQVNDIPRKVAKSDGKATIFVDSTSIMDCCKRASRFFTTPQQAAKQMDIIVRNLNTKFHRALTREEIRQSGGIPLVESDTLPLSSCRLLECVFDREAKGTKVYLDGTGPEIPDPSLDPVSLDEEANKGQ